MAGEKLQTQAQQQQAKAGSRKIVDKWKRKKWFTIFASRIFEKKQLADTPAEKPKNLEGRTLKVTLDTLTGQRMKRDVILSFRVFDIQGQNAYTKVSGFEMNHSSMGRIVRRRSSKVALIEEIPVKGGKARITIVALTARKAVKKQETGIRKIISDELAKYRDVDFEDVVRDLLFGEFSDSIFKKAKKICLLKKVIPVKAKFSETK